MTALGYEDASELVGRPSHETIHYKRPDGSHFPAEECAMLLPRITGERIHAEDWFVRRDGSMLPVEYWSASIETPSGRGAVVAFVSVAERRRVERALRERDIAEARNAELRESESRHRATLEAAFDAIVSTDREGRVTYFNTAARHTFGYTPDESLGREIVTLIVPPRLRERHRQWWSRRLLAEDPKVLGRQIKAVAMHSDGSELPVEFSIARVIIPGPTRYTAYFRDITERQRSEQELLAARHRHELVAAEQAALRRVATLIARGASPRAVFDAVCEETGHLIAASNVNLAQFTPDGFNLTVAGWSLRETHVPTGTRLPLDGETVNVVIQRTRAPARVDSYEAVSEELAEVIRRRGIKSEVGAPVVVDGSVWGALIAGSDQEEHLPAGSESRLARFAELIATAISNATAHGELIAARRRVIEAADAARQRVTRDLHDGAQQQLVTTVINLQLAKQHWSSTPERAKELLDLALQDATRAIEGLRELAAGIHPAILTDRGLAAAMDALAARFPIPIELDVPDLRLPGSVEASLYFLCSEALTNVVKHARAHSASVRIALERDRCVVEIRDDGIGRAKPSLGSSGLIGLQDRIGALTGALTINSPPGAGTTLRASVPCYPTRPPDEAVVSA